MKVCWFTNVPLPGACRALGKSVPLAGGWLDGLSTALIKTGQVELMAITFLPGAEDVRLFADGIHHYHLAIPPKVYPRELWFRPSDTTRRKCREALAGFQPDLVHIHGTEYTYGLLFAEGEIPCPTIIGIQGPIEAYSRPQSYGLSAAELLKSHTLPEWIRRRGIFYAMRVLKSRIKIERKILSSAAAFAGRTRFDEACLRAVNPNATYYHCDRILRAPFYTTKRDPRRIAPRTVFSPVGWDSRKGFHCLIKAMALIRDEFPDLQLRVPAPQPRRSWRESGYCKYICRLIRKFKLDGRVAFLGELSAEQMAQELAQAEIFAFASYADNSPNTLAEAMVVGTPVVASLVGGVPSMVRDGETALCFPAGDEIVMAECLRMLLNDPELAEQLARQAQKVARQRHDPARVSQTMLTIYHNLLQRNP